MKIEVNDDFKKNEAEFEDKLYCEYNGKQNKL